MTLSGIVPLRNVVKLDYPFELALHSLRRLCDEVIVLVDPTSEDETLARVGALVPETAIRIVESVWDMTNRRGHTNCEIAVQTAKACEAATGDWVLSLQADEVIHEADVDNIRKAVTRAEVEGVSGIELERIYFYGSLERYRTDWTFWLLRLFQRGRWQPNADAMSFDASAPGERAMRIPARIYHYARVGDPQAVAERVRNLDGFFHEPERITTGEIPPYDFSTLRKLDTYVVGHQAEPDATAELRPFSLDKHPAGVVEYFHGR